MPQTHKQKVGKIGEDIACKFLERKGFSVVTRNYWKKCGEIDIVVERGDVVHFIEVKTVSRDFTSGNPAYDTNEYRPEDNLHPWKMKRISRTIQTYLLEKNVPEKIEWRFDVVIVFLDQTNRVAKVRYMDNIIL